MNAYIPFLFIIIFTKNKLNLLAELVALNLQIIGVQRELYNTISPPVWSSPEYRLPPKNVQRSQSIFFFAIVFVAIILF